MLVFAGDFNDAKVFVQVRCVTECVVTAEMGYAMQGASLFDFSLGIFVLCKRPLRTFTVQLGGNSLENLSVMG